MQNYKKIVIAFLIYVLSLLLITYNMQGKEIWQFLLLTISSLAYLLYILDED